MTAPLIKFKTGGWLRDVIERTECSRETEQSIWIALKGGGESRQAKVSGRTHFHDTWELARAHLLKVAEGEVVHTRRMLELANAKLGNIKGMKPPKVTP